MRHGALFLGDEVHGDAPGQACCFGRDGPADKEPGAEQSEDENG